MRTNKFMPDMSLPASIFWNNVSNYALGLGALLVLMGTIGAFWTGGIKERYANERIAANEAETARAKAESSSAELRIAELNLQIAKIKEPRQVNEIEIHSLIDKLALYSGTAFDLAINDSDPEAALFAPIVARVLNGAGWVQKNWKAGGWVDTYQNGTQVGRETAFGLLFIVRKDTNDGANDHIQEAATLAANVWNEIGIEARVWIHVNDRYNDPANVGVIVGRKPY